MTDHIGLDAVPDDENLIKWLRVKFGLANVELLEYQQEFNEVVELTKENDEPIEFAYARLLNNLATKTEPELIRMLSAFIWRFSKP